MLGLPGKRDGNSGGAPLLFSADPNSEEEYRIDESRVRRLTRLTCSDRWFCLIGAAAFVAVAAAAPFLLESDRSPPALVAPLLVLAFAFAARVEFEVGQGSAVPTQLVLVPMLFVLPLGIVPACVALALLLSDAPLFLTRRAHPERATVLILSSWYVLGPVVVLSLAGEGAPEWAAWPVYVAALLAQFAVDSAASAGRAWFAFRIPPRAQIGAMASVWAVDATLAPVGLFAAFAAPAAPYSFLAGMPLILLLGLFARERRARITNAHELSSAHRGTALLLSDVIEADDEYTGAHSRDVVTLVRAVAERLGLDPRSARNAEFVALLHDVGKIRTPKHIVNKPGPLSPGERSVIEQHATEGERMLVAVGGILADVGSLVRSCHERWDGQGYPDGLAGEEIPLVARIVCACDAFSAITTTRPYRQGRSVEAALAELRRCAGADFDPRVVDALVAVVEADLPQAAGVASRRPLGFALPVTRQP